MEKMTFYRKFRLILLFCITISFIGYLDFFIPVIADSNSSDNLYKIEQSPISISSNSELHQLALSEGWNGSGTESDPIKITNYFISPSIGIGIEIKYTTDYIIVENNIVIMNGGGSGIFLQDVSNLVLFNNTVFNSSNAGLDIINSSVNITSNVLEGNYGYGINILSGDNCIINYN
ncbi:MAG: right-handed parallel beta-helix repeat-containing protein, partial [Candidatus Hodarchaeales archaeon]